MAGVKKHAAPGQKGVSGAGDGSLRTLLDATSDYALLMDLSGTVLAANTAMAKRLGMPLDGLVGSCLYDHLRINLLKKSRAVIEKIARTRAPHRFEDRTGSGNVLEARANPVLDRDGEVFAVAVFIRDITAAKRDEEERMRLASAIEQAGEAFVIFDSEFTISYVNQAFETSMGYSQEEIKGQGVDGLYKGGAANRCYQEMAEAMVQGEVWSGRVTCAKKDGADILCQATVSPIRGRYGVPLGYVGIWRDVTNVEILEREVRQAQKMEAIATLSSGIAHDFNNILGPIIIYSELGLNLLPEAEPVRRSFGHILEAANRAKSLVNQILNLGHRREDDEPVAFRLSSIIKECLKLLRPSLPATIRIDQRFEAEDDLILADPTRTHQVIMNLCTNAAHAMRPDGGVLTIALREVEIREGGRHGFPSAALGPYVLLTVRDTGHGIAGRDMGKIFDPFFTTKRAGIGTGLGLTVVHSIVTKHLKGAVRVESEEGKGAAFYLLIPKSADPMEVPEEFARGDLLAKGLERILLV
ncbi:MAG: PAS domain S-box protein, partial [Desulfovibrionaceae bacterium]|nr:PAS domain S-box protein [Desulfovibrionaceae bacterium]